MVNGNTMSTKQKSMVWKYFVRTGSGGKCKMCQIDIKTGGNTTNLKNHLQRKHAKILDMTISVNPKKQKTQYNVNNDEYVDNSEIVFVPSPSVSETSDSSISTKYESLKENMTKPVQPRIDKALLNVKAFEDGGFRKGLITNAILYMIAKDNLPFNTVEKEGFQYLMKIAVPLYKVPERKTITKLMEEKYEVLSNIMKTKLSMIDHLCLTADVWTDTINTKSYLGITTHFVLSENITSIVIGVTELSERHTSSYLGQWLSQICVEWHIEINKVIAIVTDNAPNITKAVIDVFGTEKHLSCFAHSLNLVATSILKDNSEVEALCEKVKALVTYFKHSVVAADELRKFNTKKLIQCVPTRWNSIYYMLERFIELSENISIVLLKLPKAPPMISAVELQLAKEVVQILSPLESVTKDICGENYVTASKVIPLINCLKKKLNALSSVLTSIPASNLLKSLISNIITRFGNIECISILAISTLLDPRFKRLHFNNHIAWSRAVNKVSQQIEISSNNMSTVETIVITDSTVVSNKSIWSYHEDLANQTQLIHTKHDDMPSDLKHYLNQPTINLNDNPISYWMNTYKSIYPSLRVIAKKYLPIMATSVPSERLFSKAGNIMIESRNRLSSQHLQQLLFLNSLSLNDWKINE